jgi:hypothetical protein
MVFENNEEQIFLLVMYWVFQKDQVYRKYLHIWNLEGIFSAFEMKFDIYIHIYVAISYIHIFQLLFCLCDVSET